MKILRRTFLGLIAVIILLTYEITLYNDPYQATGLGFVDSAEVFRATALGEDKDLVLYARSAILIDGNNARVLYEKKGYEKMPMASTTKIMTCLLALELCDLDDTVIVSKKAASAPKVKLYIKEGEKYKLKDLLYALMLESSNDVAVAIAEHTAGDVESFCELMTKRAKKIGANSTSYKTPNGLDAEGHYSTAYDLAIITKEALNNKQFIEITNTRSYNFVDLSGQRSFNVNNKNNFLNMMDGAMGVKTGFTCAAGYCFVGAVRNEEEYYISVVLGSGWPPNRGYKWKDTLTIMKYAQKEYAYEEILSNNIVLEPIKVKQGVVDSCSACVTGEISLLLKSDDVVSYVLNYDTTIEAPVNPQTILGTIDIYINETKYMSLDVMTNEYVLKRDYKYCFNKILDRCLKLVDFILFK